MIDATVGGASSNSYLTVAEADAFAQADLGSNARAWLSATDETKEAALIRATLEVDEEVGRVFLVAYPVQKLLFPRAEDIVLGVYYLPTRLLRATYLQAAFDVVNADTLDQALMVRARGLSNFSNPDGVTGQVDMGDAGRIHPKVRALLGEFSEGSVIGTIVRE